MSKFHFLSLIFFCVFYTQSIHAQNITLEPMQCSVCPPPQTNKFNKTLTIVFDGYKDGYSRPNYVFTYSMEVNGIMQTQQFTTATQCTFTCPFNQSFGNIEIKLLNTVANTWFWSLLTTYYNYSTNQMQIG